MKKLFTLLTLLLGISSGAWADTVIYSWEGAQAGATETGGAIKSYATDGGDETTDDINMNNGANDFWYIRLRGAANFSSNVVKITLNSALAVGDQIKVTGYRNKDATGKTSGFKAKFDKGSSTVGSSTGFEFVNINLASGNEYSDTPNTCTFDVPSDAAGSTVITMTRSHTSTNLFVTKIEIVRAEATAPTITTQPISASYKQNATATALTVAATASAGTLSYQWYSNTAASTEGATAIDGETTDSYTPSTATLGKTYYYCAVTDGNGTTNSEFAAITVANTSIVGYTEAINGSNLNPRVLSSEDANVTISTECNYGSAITDQGSKTVYIDNTAYTNDRSWRKSVKDSYDNQYVGYTLTVASGYKMNVKNINARIAVADDTYKWYVEILDGAGTQVWKSGERTTTKASSGMIDNVDVSDKADIQGLTGNVTVNLYVKQDGSTKYFSINYLQLTVETEVDARPTYVMSVSSNDETMGTVTPADGSTVTEGESVAFTATPTKVDYKFVKWTIDGTDYTDNPFTLTNVTATHTAVATFAKRFKVTYELGEYAGNTGKVLNNVKRENGYDEVWSADDDSYTIPTYSHKYLYREGYIFDQWQDGDGNTYASGDKIDMTKDITLTPTWKATSQSLSASCAETEVTWTFAKADILFCDWQSDSKSGYYTQNAAVNGETIAVPMSITAGKVGNWSRTDAIAQTNQNTKFTIPAISGMVIEIAEANVVFSTTTIAGSTEYEGTGTNSISYTYNGTDATIDIVIGENNQYLKTIKVTYPATLTEVTKTISDAGYATFYTDVPITFGSDVEAYIATMDGTIVKFTKVDDVPANTGVLLKGTEGEKTFTVATSTTDVTANKFVGVLADTEVDGGIYVLMAGTADNEGTGFYKTNTEKKFTVGANTAYLPADVAGARTFIGFDFDGDETSGINSALVNNENGEVYNLQGQRVVKAQKGLYIMNGKKVLVK